MEDQANRRLRLLLSFIKQGKYGFIGVTDQGSGMSIDLLLQDHEDPLFLSGFNQQMYVIGQ
jgi:hypothetical protein